MRRVGDILVGARAITPELRDRILEQRGRVPVRFGTAVLESGAVPEDVLLRALSVQSGAPGASALDLAAIPPDVLRLVPHKLAIRHFAIPLRRMGRSLHLAMRDPKDLAAVDEIAFLTGMTVVPHVAAEVRIAMALERYYGVAAESRLKTIAARLDGVLPPGPDPGPVPAATGETEETTLPSRLATQGAVPTRPVPSSRPPAFSSSSSYPASHVESVSAESPWDAGNEAIEYIVERDPGLVVEVFASEPVPGASETVTSVASAAAQGAEVGPRADAPAQPSRPAEISGDETSLVLDLGRAESRDDIAEAVLAEARGHAGRVALFIVQADRTIGWAALPDPPAGFRSFSIPFIEPSVFATLRNTDGFYTGPVPDQPGNHRILAAVGAGVSTSLAVVPVTLRGKTVLFLLAAPDPSALAPPIGELRRLATMTATALEIVLLRNRLRTL